VQQFHSAIKNSPWSISLGQGEGRMYYCSAIKILSVMKTIFSTSLMLMFLSIAPFAAKQTTAAAPPGIEFSVSVPVQVQSQIVREDFENQSIFSFKNEGGKPVFLFSVNRLSAEQWLKVKNSFTDYSIIENKEGRITFIQKTGQLRIKGKNAESYQQVFQQIDGMIATVKLAPAALQ
jgi:hypothetical protein